MSEQTNKIDDGGSAFPVQQVDYVHPTQFGMTLRDYFAAKAMAALLVRGPNIGEVYQLIDPPELKDSDEVDQSVLAMEAYWIADAMLVARKAVTA